MPLKICHTCKKELELKSFNLDKQKKSGFNPNCKNCYSEKRKKSLSKYNSSEKHKDSNKKWKIRNKQKVKNKSKIDRKAYYLRLKQATICGFKPYSLLRMLYKKSREETKKTGIQHSIDHIIPLAGKEICGLNVPWNIQIIPLMENNKKRNSWSQYGY